MHNICCQTEEEYRLFTDLAYLSQRGCDELLEIAILDEKNGHQGDMRLHNAFQAVSNQNIRQLKLEMISNINDHLDDSKEEMLPTSQNFLEFIEFFEEYLWTYGN